MVKEAPRGASSPAKADDGFDEFWKLYPRKTGKQAARRAWKKAVKQKPAAEIAAALIEQLPALHLKLKPEGDFRPYPSKWLNEGRWDDEVDQPKPTRNPSIPEGW